MDRVAQCSRAVHEQEALEEASRLGAATFAEVSASTGKDMEAWFLQLTKKSVAW
jgi:hypothetical protein